MRILFLTLAKFPTIILEHQITWLENPPKLLVVIFQRWLLTYFTPISKT
ncbi:MAG: hypothetical protein IJM82_08875 [Synergistaceae bacterium]|nr:hypothetical protein [Synergistaceae bacterium]MBR0079018.1 hypothetical protein [Synergistaceae bacterium]MBR0253918.1 hypothetical protein [Synergistaceae bacterium]